jgi:RNA polymerase sigma-70 factor (ECF subfamily)
MWTTVQARRDRLDVDTRFVHAYAAARSDLLTALTRMLGSRDDALDVAQTAFLKCWRRRKQLDDIRDLRAWIFRVGLNAGRDLRRDAWRRRARPLLAVPDRPVASAFDQPDREEIERLESAVADLRPAEREVFLLRQKSDRTYDEIAALCSVPVGTIKTRMRTALGKLRVALKTAAAG